MDFTGASQTWRERDKISMTVCGVFGERAVTLRDDLGFCGNGGCNGGRL